MWAAGRRPPKRASSMGAANCTRMARRPASSSIRSRFRMGDPVRYEVRDSVAVITIDNPPVNALSPAVWEGLDRAVARANADTSALAIVIIGAGATFIAGAD